jgi:hypothetical protein
MHAMINIGDLSVFAPMAFRQHKLVREDGAMAGRRMGQSGLKACRSGIDPPSFQGGYVDSDGRRVFKALGFYTAEAF